MGSEPIWKRVRENCYKFLLTRLRDVQAAYARIPGDGTRRCELWRPLGAVLEVLCVTQTRLNELKDYFWEATESTRYKLSVKEEALFQVVCEQVPGGSTIDLTAGNLTGEMAKLLPAHEPLDPREVGKMISKFDLSNEKRKQTRQKLVHYIFDGDKVRDIAKRYGANVELVSLKAA